MDGLRFGPDWRETFVLADQTACVLRLIRPGDKDKIAAGLAKMSPKSQYLRFFTAKVRLTEPELRYLTEIDGHNHFAIGVVRELPDGGEGDGVAVARFVRVPGEPEVAEPAIAVIDELQGQGLGGHLLRLLVEAARERQIRRFRTEFLATNTSMKSLMSQLSAHATFVADGPIVVSEVPLDGGLEEQRAVEGARAPGFEWLRLVAANVVTLRRRFAMLFDASTLRRWLGRLRSELGYGEVDEESDEE